jgi:uncharacterized RDD family membrane protein YckC
MVAYALDAALIVISSVVIGWFVQVMFSVLPGSPENLGVNLNYWLGLTLGISAFVFYIWIYFLFFWSLVGWTPGKLVMGLRVVSKDGGRVSFWRAIRRMIGYLLSTLALYLGYLWILVDDRRQGWHDKLAGTYVIYDWDARPGERFVKRVNEWYAKKQKQEPDSAT